MLDLHIHAGQAREIIAEYYAASPGKDRDIATYQALGLLQVLLAIHDRNQEVGK